jgi:hypothetical protein
VITTYGYEASNKVQRLEKEGMKMVRKGERSKRAALPILENR